MARLPDELNLGASPDRHSQCIKHIQGFTLLTPMNSPTRTPIVISHSSGLVGHLYDGENIKPMEDSLLVYALWDSQAEHFKFAIGGNTIIDRARQHDLINQALVAMVRHQIENKFFKHGEDVQDPLSFDFILPQHYVHFGGLPPRNEPNLDLLDYVIYTEHTIARLSLKYPGNPGIRRLAPTKPRFDIDPRELYGLHEQPARNTGIANGETLQPVVLASNSSQALGNPEQDSGPIATSGLSVDGLQAEATQNKGSQFNEHLQHQRPDATADFQSTIVGALASPPSNSSTQAPGQPQLLQPVQSVAAVGQMTVETAEPLIPSNETHQALGNLHLIHPPSASDIDFIGSELPFQPTLIWAMHDIDGQVAGDVGDRSRVFSAGSALRPKITHNAPRQLGIKRRRKADPAPSLNGRKQHTSSDLHPSQEADLQRFLQYAKVTENGKPCPLPPTETLEREAKRGLPMDNIPEPKRPKYINPAMLMK